MRLLILCAFCSLAWCNDSFGDFPKSVDRFISNNCVDCHEGEQSDGGLDLTKLNHDLSDHKTMSRWVRIFDRVRDGEMPPEDMGELDPTEAAEFLEATSGWLRETQQAEHDKLGRVRSRRLTRMQLERTLHDLLAIDVPFDKSQ